MSSVLYALYATDSNVDILGLDIQVNAVATVLKAFLKLSFDKNSTTLPCYMSSVLYALYIADSNVDILGLDIQVNAVATVLKAFFSDLTDPLVPVALYDELIEASGR